MVDDLRFEHVDFEYRAGVGVINDFDLSVSRGMVVALVGPSGAGKTTSTDLVARFYDPTQGTIMLNGIDPPPPSPGDLSQPAGDRAAGCVPVRWHRCGKTLLMAVICASDDQIIDAARRADADEFIEQLPDGYDTLIGERGSSCPGASGSA